MSENRLEIVLTRRKTKQLAISGELPFQLLSVLSSITTIKQGKGEIYVPLEYNIALIVMRQLPNAVLHSNLQQWLQDQENFEDRRLALKGLPDVDIGENGRNLYPYQRVGANFLAHAKRAILADSAGLGKTSQAILATTIPTQAEKILVVCPNALKLWWQYEINRWNSGQPISVIDGTPKKRKEVWEQYQRQWGYLIVNWEQLRLLPELGKIYWDWIIGDEAHRLKNRNTQLFKAAKEIQSERLALLTATPVGNDPSELWTLLHLCTPERFTSFWRFYNAYVAYIQTPFGRKIVGSKNESELRRTLAPIMIRRTKAEVGIQLPAKNRRVLPLELTSEQRRMYQQMAKAMYTTLDNGDTLEAWSAVAQITRLRQIVSTTATLQENDHSAKLDALMDLIADEGPGEQWVIFSQYRGTVEAILRRCKAANLTAVAVMGGMEGKEVNERVAQFQRKEKQIFVATTGAGGVGLNLQNAHFLVHVELGYNPIINEQAEDRVHRIGQNQDVFITELHCPGTVDDLVRRILERKISMAEAVLRNALFQHLEEVSKW